MTSPTNMRPYDYIIPYLTGNEDFRLSNEFRMLAGTGDDLPGVVTCAYANYICKVLSRLQSTELARSLLAPFNEFYRWDDPKVNDLIRDEFFEQIIECKNIKQITNAMSEKLARHFAQWSGEIPGTPGIR